MTREEKIDAFTMRIDGYSLQEIGNKYGITRQGIWKMFSDACKERGIGQRTLQYHNIARWMHEHKVNQGEFAKMIGVRQGTVSSWMHGKESPRMEYMRRIMEVTGMPFEVAFKGEES